MGLSSVCVLSILLFAQQRFCFPKKLANGIEAQVVSAKLISHALGEVEEAKWNSPSVLK